MVRHAKAGSRHKWDGDDRERPLSGAGRRQAAAITERLAGEHVTGLYASHYARCVQTLEPLGKRLGLDVVADARLAEAASFESTLELLAEAGDGAVLCSHGDVIPDTIDALVRRGLDVRSPPDWRKASVWVLKRNKHGTFTRAVVWAPPGA